MIKFGRISLIDSGNAYGMVAFPVTEDALACADGFYNTFALLPEQTHSLNVAIAENHYQSFPDTDALITFERDLPIGVRTADCVPILIYCPDGEAVAAVHAGWRGSLGGIVDKVIDVLTEKGCDPAKMEAVIGPAISMEKYEVDEDLADQFRQAGFADSVLYPEGAGSKPHIDLKQVNRERLIHRGLRSENISVSPECTYSAADANGEPIFQSYRRDGKSAARNLTMISLTRD